MKKLNSKAAFVIMMIIVAISCSDNSYQSIQEQNQSVLMKTGKDLAFNHNECLAKIFNDLTSVKTRAALENDVIVQDMIIASANDYINLNNDILCRIDKKDFEISIEEIEASVSKKELFYIKKAISMGTNMYFDKLIKDVEADNELDENRKLAVICFITTYDASTEYWNEHLNEWLELMNKPQTRASLSDVAFADAWWGFQGMLMSGLNPIAGGGLAAVASAGTAIWGRKQVFPEASFIPEDSIYIIEQLVK